MNGGRGRVPHFLLDEDEDEIYLPPNGGASGHPFSLISFARKLAEGR
jgi:hypothetical protein